MSLKTKVQALLTAANAKTSASDATLTDAVKTLIDGYGQGGGGGSQPQKDVNFIDYDGTILHSYTAAEFAALTAMPDNPDHSSDIQWGGHTIALTSQGWNYTLEKAQAYVAKYGKLWIGQMYKTTDGKLHLCVRVGEGRLSPAGKFRFDGTATVDWGDGTAPTSVINNVDSVHTYAAAGDYDVALYVGAGGKLYLSGDYGKGSYFFKKPDASTDGDTSTDGNVHRVYQNCICMAFIPDGTESVSAFAFEDCHSLKSITIPDGVTYINGYAFHNCYSLQSVTIPDGVTVVDSYSFQYCQSLKRVAIPDSVTNINSYAFASCYSLQSVTIPDSVTHISMRAFASCYSLQSATIPDSVTNIDPYVFEYCSSLQSVTIPNGITGIYPSLFRYCYSLQGITIPDSVTSISGDAFDACAGLGFIRFEPATPPSTGSNAWESVPTDCIIYVPAASLDAYKSSESSPDPSIYTYIGY